MIDQIKTEMSEHLFGETIAQLELNIRYLLRAEAMNLIGERIWDNCGVHLFRELRSYDEDRV